MRSSKRVHATPSASTGDLAKAIAEAEGGFGEKLPAGVVRTGWASCDRAFGGLRRGVLHEWLVEPCLAGLPVGSLTIFEHLATRALADEHSRPLVLWIGMGCQPYAASLGSRLLERSVFVDVHDLAERLWAIDVALRSPSVGVVIADAGGLGMRESRRLQLAASVGRGLCLLARPANERGEISAAWTRWAVSATPSNSATPRWALELLRCKGVQPTEWSAQRWFVHRDREKGVVNLVPDAPDRCDSQGRPTHVASA